MYEHTYFRNILSAKMEDDNMNKELRERMDSLLKELNNKLFSKGIVYDACTMRRRNKNQFVIELVSNGKHPRGYYIEMYDVLDSNNVCGGENAEPEYLITRQFVLDNYNALCEIAKKLEFSKIDYPKDYSLSNLLVWFGSEKQESISKSNDIAKKNDDSNTGLSFDTLSGPGSFNDINKILNNNDCTNPKLDTIYPGKFSDYCIQQYNFNTQPVRPMERPKRNMLLAYSNQPMRSGIRSLERELNTIINDSIKIEFEELHNIKHILEKMYITRDSNNNANIIIYIKEYPSDMYESEEFNGRDLFIAVPLVISSNIFKGSMLMNQFTGFGIKRISAIEMMNTLRDLFEDVDILLIE